MLYPQNLYNICTITDIATSVRVLHYFTAENCAIEVLQRYRRRKYHLNYARLRILMIR